MKKLIELILFYLVGFFVIYGMIYLIKYTFNTWNFYVGIIIGLLTFIVTIKFLDKLAEKVDSYLNSDEDNL